MDYTIFYKYSYDNSDLSDLPHYDLFLSAYDDSERTKVIFDKIDATEKKWLYFPQYSKVEFNFSKNNYYNKSMNESDYFNSFFEAYKKENVDKLICIDITGFIRQHIIYMLRYMYEIGVKYVDLIYTEPNKYIDNENTIFSGYIDSVKNVDGCSSFQNNPDTENDLLIVCAGYDDYLMSKISQMKDKCKKKYFILGFPSLQPDMYQESSLKLYNIKNSIGENIHYDYAPAFDPFVTAQVIEKIINNNPESSNIFLSPLSTKPQTVGMALYYMMNFKNKSINIISPVCNYYNPNNAEGVKRTWRYTLEF